ncbi:hypothetical protein CRUP_001942 [Coryphaenoides rupestris]|nr:hypothetical protein CRUP_001942 [Coryphaenoides rupestris]
MDAIYGHRPANNGREGGLDTATTLLQSMIEDEPTSEESVPQSDDSSLLTDSSITSPTSATASTPAPAPAMSNTRVVTGKRKRSLCQQDHVMRDIHADDVAQQEQNRAQRDSHIQLLLTEAREARAQTAAFNQTFLGLLGQLVQAMSDRRT